MLGSMTYEEAKAEYDLLEAEAKATSEVLRAFPRGPTGLTPDAVRATPEYRAAKTANDTVFARQRQFNAVYVKLFAKELSADRDARYAARAAKAAK